eukprot:scaffold13933_cov219-Amphora_coffeaeformis.AAC.3
MERTEEAKGYIYLWLEDSMITVVLRRCRRPLLGLLPVGIFDMETLRVALTGVYPLGIENCAVEALRKVLFLAGL